MAPGKTKGKQEQIWKDLPILISVHDGRYDGVYVGRGADEEEDNEEKRLKVEDGCLG